MVWEVPVPANRLLSPAGISEKSLPCRCIRSVDEFGSIVAVVSIWNDQCPSAIQTNLPEVVSTGKGSPSQGAQSHPCARTSTRLMPAAVSASKLPKERWHILLRYVASQTRCDNEPTARSDVAGSSPTRSPFGSAGLSVSPEANRAKVFDYMLVGATAV